MRTISKVDGVVVFDNGDPARDEYVPPDEINVRQAGAVGDGVTDDTAIIQACLDAGPCYFPPGEYLVTGTGDACLTVSKNYSHRGADPKRSRLVGDGGLGATTDVLRIAFTENGNNTDVRNWSLSGLGVLAPDSGRHAIYVHDDTNSYPILTSAITNCNLLGYATNSGHALYVNDNLAHCEIALNTLQSPVHMACRDANSIRKNLCFGLGVAVTFDLIYGVYNNTVEHNTIVNRDGAVRIVNGDAVRILNNQIELSQSYGASQSATSSMVWVEGADRVAYNTVIEGNNFGGGTNLDHLVYLDNAQKSVVSRNQMIACNVAEVYLTANAKYNVLTRDNTVKGTINNPRTRTRFKEKVTDLGVGNAGVLHPGSELAHQNSWAGGDFFKDASGVVHFASQLTSGVAANGTLIGTLPVGFRPPVNTRIACPTSGGIGQLMVASSGDITASGALPSNVIYPTSFLAGNTDL